MFLAVNDFFLPSVNHWPLVGIAKVAAKPLDDIAGSRIVVAAFRAFISLGGRCELTFETAFESLINRRVGAKITDFIVCIVPHRFQCLRILLQVRVFAIVDEATGTVLRIVLFKVELFKWCG